mgnify:CR=1 FL=1
MAISTDQLLDFVREYQRHFPPFEDGTGRRIPMYDSNNNSIILTLDRRDHDGLVTATRHLLVSDMVGGAREIISFIDKNFEELKRELDAATL